ncbi:MAG: glycosyltransferase family 4 protein [Thaumarchaeota archaeon]|nr:glycosyltransferase family 4 protein [Nitrososphaerota archaeon]
MRQAQGQTILERILLVTFDPPENIGGIEGRSKNYARELRRRGYFVDVMSLSPSYPPTRALTEPGVTTRLNSSTLQAPSSLATTIRIVTRDALTTVLLVSGSLTVFGLTLMAFCRMSGRHTVAFLYGRDILVARNSVIGRVLLLFALRLADNVATNSRFTSGLLPKGGKYLLVFPAVDPRILDMTTATRLNDDSVRILFVGRLVERKGADLLLKVFGDLVTQIPRAKLDIVGDGPESGSLRDLARKLDVQDKVSFHGALVGTPLYDLFVLSDVLVMPSRTTKVDVEGFGTVFLEAGLFGKPSVATRTGGIPEAILDEETGLLVPEDDPRALAGALRRILTDQELRQRLGARARDRAATQFSLDRAIDALEKAIRE